MRKAQSSGNRQPTPSQTLLLRAAMLQGEPAVEAWHAWRAKADLDAPEAGTFALLPLLYYNLHNQGISDPWLVKCKGIYRRTWSQNQLILQQVAALLRALQSADIQPLLLDDTALLLAHYPDYGLRMLQQVDVATSPEQAAQVLPILQEQGWQPLPDRQPRPSAHLEISQTRCFQRVQGSTARLRWHIIPHNGTPPTESVLWQSTIPVSVNQVETLTLSMTELLLACCTQEPQSQSIQWIVDAMLLLQGPVPAIDWSHLQHRAAEQALALRLSYALHYLHDFWHAPIPTHVLQQVTDMTVQPFEQQAAQWQRHWPSSAAKAGTLWSEYQRRRWWQQQTGLPHDSSSLPQYLQERFALEHAWQIPVHLGKVCLRRLAAVGNR